MRYLHELPPVALSFLLSIVVVAMRWGTVAAVVTAIGGGGAGPRCPKMSDLCHFGRKRTMLRWLLSIKDTASEGVEMRRPSRDMVLLAIGQALSGTVVSLLTSVSSLSGEMLAPYGGLSTVPVSATVCGSLLMIYPASTIMGRLGRRIGFLLKAIVGIAGGSVSAGALFLHSFPTLILGTFLLGIFSAFSQYYRFAAIDAARSPDERTQAVAMITGAGVVGGILGPFLGSRFDGALGVPFIGSFIALTMVCVAIAISQIFLSAELGRDQSIPSDRPSATSHFTPSSEFLAASILCAVGFSAMTLTMNAAPLSLARDPLCAGSTTTVLQAHFIAMYLPSLFNASLVRLVGLRGLVSAGLLALLLMAASAQILDATPFLYLAQLVLSGIGWNFVFNGGTLLVASTYSTDQKTQAQGVNSLIVYGANVLASFAAGVLVAQYDWQILNLTCVPIVLTGVLFVLKRWMAGKPQTTAARS
jgi:MFS family permease